MSQIDLITVLNTKPDSIKRKHYKEHSFETSSDYTYYLITWKINNRKKVTIRINGPTRHEITWNRTTFSLIYIEFITYKFYGLIPFYDRIDASGMATSVKKDIFDRAMRFANGTGLDLTDLNEYI